MPGYDPGTYGLRNQVEHLDRRESSRIDGEASTADAQPRASTRIHEQAFVDGVSLDLIKAHGHWIAGRDRGELRRMLLRLILKLDS